jgi:hypothetical protein
MNPIDLPKRINLVACGAWLLAVAIAAAADAPKLCPTPPMGWNSFDSYGVYLSEASAMANLEAMAVKLKPHGYEYFVIDNGWFGEYRLVPGTRYAAEKHASDVRLDEFGRFLPSQTYFPNGFGPLVRRARELGLKFGVHLMRGIPRKAVAQNLPIKGTAHRAAEIANTNPKDNCTWCTYNYGVDMSKPGAQAWYDSLIQHIADYGVDFIKYDDIVPYPAEVEAVAKAIAKTGKPIVLSLSPGGKVDPNALESFRTANMLRVTPDIWDEEKGLNECFEAWRKWGGKERPGFWIDMDMIPFGQLALMNPPTVKGPAGLDIALAGKGTTRWAGLSRDQMLTFITMRALAASPLMVGGDLPTLDAFSHRLLIDPDMIACNRNGVMGRLVHEAGGIEIWLTPQRGTDGKRGWIGVFNRGWSAAPLTLTPALLGLGEAKPSVVRDIWNASRTWRPKVLPELPVSIAAGGVLFLRFD